MLDIWNAKLIEDLYSMVQNTIGINDIWVIYLIYINGVEAKIRVHHDSGMTNFIVTFNEDHTEIVNVLPV